MSKPEPQDHKAPAEPVTLSTSKGALTLPHPTKLPSGVIRKARKIEDAGEQFFVLIESLFDEDSPELELCDSLGLEELAEILTEWLQGASLGESSGSSI